MFQTFRTLAGQSTVSKLLRSHFHGWLPHTLVTTGRTFPIDPRPMFRLRSMNSSREVRALTDLACNVDGLPCAVLIGRGSNIGMGLGVQVEVAIAAGDAGLKFSERFFDTLEKETSKGRT